MNFFALLNSKVNLPFSFSEKLTPVRTQDR